MKPNHHGPSPVKVGLIQNGFFNSSMNDVHGRRLRSSKFGEHFIKVEQKVKGFWSTAL
jgi:hypothetical protein